MAKRPKLPQGKPAESGAPKTSRAHHYIPEFYLAGFTLSGTREDTLWVLDQQQGKCWPATPRNTGRQRDFYRVDVDGVEPDLFEKDLGRFESEAAKVFQTISDSPNIPEGEDLAVLLNFVALQETRVPQHRQWYEEQVARLSKWRMRWVLGHPQAFEQIVADMQREGNDLPDSLSREKLLDFLEDESAYTVEIRREASIHHMAKMAADLVPVLAQRSWSLAVAKDDEHDFICSDRPVSLLPTEPDATPFPGFALRNTEVIMPLNRRMALLGRYGSQAELVEVDAAGVGLFNSRTLHLADRFVYAARQWFPVSVPREAGRSSVR